MLLQKIDEQDSDFDSNKPLNDLVTEITRQATVVDAVKMIKNRDFRVIDEIKRLSWTKLDLTEPKLSLYE